MDDKNADHLFKTLSDPTRRGLARLLGEAPLTVGEIVEILRLPQSTVSRHLKSLRSTGLLTERREGSRLITALAEPVENGDAELAGLLNQWLREQPLSAAVRRRLDQVVKQRNGGRDVFERLASQWDELRRSYFGVCFHLEALWALLPERWHILDIGTGTGYLLPALSRQFQKVTAVDPSPAMLSLARRRARHAGLSNVRFEAGSLESLPLEDESVDAALAVLVLHHAVDLDAALSELHRVLKSGGQLLAVDLAPHSMERFQREMADPIAGLDPVLLTKEMRRAGFLPKLKRPPATSIGEEGGPEKEAPELFLIKCRRP